MVDQLVDFRYELTPPPPPQGDENALPMTHALSLTVLNLIDPRKGTKTTIKID